MSIIIMNITIISIHLTTVIIILIIVIILNITIIISSSYSSDSSNNRSICIYIILNVKCMLIKNDNDII